MLSRLSDMVYTPPARAIRGGAVGVMLLLCAYLGPRWSMREIGLVVGALAGLVLLQRPVWGLVLVIPASLILPMAVGTGTGTEVPISLVLVGLLLAVWVLRMGRQSNWHLAPTPANIPFVALIGTAGLSIVMSGALWNPLVETGGNFMVVQLAQWAVFFLSAGAFWLTANCIDDIRWLKWMTWLYVGLGAAYVGARALPGGLLPNPFAQGADGSLFWVWLVALAGSQALFNHDLSLPRRLLLATLALGTLYVGWLQSAEWVSGWAPPALAAAVLLWLWPGRWRATARAGLVLGLIAFGPQFYRAALANAVTAGSLLRLEAWRGIISLVGSHWPIGLGLASYVFYWNDLIGYWAFSETNIVRLTSSDRVNSHNNYFDIYAQMGALGMAVFVWLAAALWLQVREARKLVSGGFEQAYVYGCMAGLVGSLVAGTLGDWFLPFVYNIGLKGMRASLLMWLFLGGTVAIQQLSGRQGSESGGE